MRIVLADDHPMIITAIEALLRGTPFEITGVATTGDEALHKAELLKPDILLLDLKMPGGTGLDVVRRIRSENKKTRIVLLTAEIDDASLIEAKALRVQGMVLKNSDPAHLLECLERVGRGGRWFDPELTKRAEVLADTLADKEARLSLHESVSWSASFARGCATGRLRRSSELPRARSRSTCTTSSTSLA